MNLADRLVKELVVTTMSLLRTPLYEVHRREGGKIVEFGGWEMPVEYAGIKQEHLEVRRNLGIFDLSHMGEVEVTGAKATEFVDYLVTNDVMRMVEGQCMYTCMCRPTGAIIDDLLVYRFKNQADGTPYYWLVVNASNCPKDVAWILEQAQGQEGVAVKDLSMATALIAVQGPRSQQFMQSFTDADLETLSYYHLTRGQVCGVKAVISRTGYTGEDGFEAYVDWADAEKVWAALRESDEIKPIGLGARDTLRLEAGFSLYGHEITEDANPIDASLGWVVKLNGGDFIGKEFLAERKAAGAKRAIVGLVVQSRGIPRQGYVVESDEGPVGVVTSGTFSPSLGRGIALASVDVSHRSVGTELYVIVRGKREQALVVRPPFVRGSVRRG